MYLYKTREEVQKSNPAIQRKVGMEFQTVGGNANIVKIPGKDMSLGSLDTTTILDKGKFKVTYDNHDLEYVTDPVDPNSLAQTSGSTSELSEIVQDIVHFHNNLFENDSNQDKKDIDDILKTCGAKINVNGQKNAHPQASMGVPLEKLEEFIERVFTPENEGLEFGGSIRWDPTPDPQQNPQRRLHMLVFNAVKNHMPHDTSPGVRGFVHLFFLYYTANCLKERINSKRQEKQEQEQNQKMQFFKSALPILSRTSFYNLYALLDENDQSTVQSIIRDIFSKIQHMEFPVLPLYKCFPEGKDGKVTFEEAFAVPGVYEKSGKIILVDDMLSGLERGEDPLATSGIKSVSSLYRAAAHISEGTTAEEQRFGVRCPTDLGYDDIKGTIVELRALKRDVPPEDWTTIAEQVNTLAKWAVTRNIISQP